MTNLAALAEEIPQILPTARGVLHASGDDLAVVVLPDGSIGQFAQSGYWSRAEVEAAVRAHAERAAAQVAAH